MNISKANLLKVNGKTMASHNERLVLQALYEYGLLSRTEITRVTSLSPSVVTHISRRLLEQKVIYEAGKRQPGRGRGLVQLALDPDAILALSLVVDFQRIRLGAVNLEGKVAEYQRIDTSNRQFSPDAIVDAIDRFQEKLKDRWDRVMGLGLVLPGTVDPPTGKVHDVPTLSLYELDVRQELRDRFQKPVVVENDVNALSLAEQWKSVNNSNSNVAYIYLDYGIGGSLFLNGQLFRGSHGAAGEVHYFPVLDAASGSYRHAGGLADGHAILTALPEALGSFPPEMAAELKAAKSTVFDQLDIVVRWALKSEKVAAFVRRFAETWGVLISALVNMVDPDLVVVCGTLSTALPVYEDIIHRKMKDLVPGFPGSHVRVIPAQLNTGQALLVGGGACALIESGHDFILNCGYRPEK
ncbi:MAG: ROK family transcriptional regulator [Firmicutes bacterium]|nr:ROK family transcriptional regulator [Bacillota bacterium]